MQQELRSLDLEILDCMHREAHVYLQVCLHQNADPQEINNQRMVINELALAINAKIRNQITGATERHYTKRDNPAIMLSC